jgi:uncharacterized membrane protein
MEEIKKTKRELIRVGKHLSELVTIKDSAGNLIHRVVKPVMLEVYPRDVMQLIVGATLLSIPVAFTEEVWKMGERLGWINIGLLFFLSLLFSSLFIYYNFYRNHFKNHKFEFIKRIVLLYLVSLGVSWLILFLVGQASFDTGLTVVIKRMIIVSFPASMSAAVADMIK